MLVKFNPENLLKSLFSTILAVTLLATSAVTANANYDPSDADSYTSLVVDDDSRNACSGDDCIPLILIHGIHGNQWEDGDTDNPNGKPNPNSACAGVQLTAGSTIPCADYYYDYDDDDIGNPNKNYFRNLLNKLYDQGLASNYKIYRFHYVSDKYSVWEIGRALRNDIDDMTDSGEFPNDRQFIIVAHSMGGLVARSYMNEHDHYSSNAPLYQNKRGGERVLKLITLATPHHGSPVADHDSRNELAENADSRDQFNSPDDWSTVSSGTSFFYWWTQWLDRISYNQPNRKDLLWDNFDLLMDGFNSDVYIQTWLPGLNTETIYDKKVIAYYGYLNPSNYEYQGISYQDIVNEIYGGSQGPTELVKYGLSDDKHIKLLAGSIAINYGLYYYETCLQAPDSTNPCSNSGYSPYENNDGMVPLQSAAFDNHTTAKQVECPNYDHLMMLGNFKEEAPPTTTCNNGLPLLDSVKSDLNDIWQSMQPKVDSFSVSSQSINLGSTLTFSFKVSDNSGSGLNRVELLRADDNGGTPGTWVEINRVSVSGNGPVTGSFSDTPSQTGTYWYGIHVVNNAGSWNDEQNANTGGLPGDYGPIQVTVTSGSSCTDSYESNDSSPQAYGPLSSGSNYSGKVCTSTDADWYKVNVSSAGTISLSLSVPTSNDYDLQLYNPSYSWVAESYNGTGISEAITYSVATTGTYYIRVYNPSGSYNTTSSYTLSYNFTTGTVPTVTTSTASSITSTGTTINGSVNPNCSSTNAWFEWGTSSNLSTYNSTPLQSLGSGTTAQSISASLSGLSPSTTYYYRVAASNSAGTSRGSSILSFTTSSSSTAQTELIINYSFSSGSSSWTTGGDFWIGNSGISPYDKYLSSPGYAAGGVESSDGSVKNTAYGYMYQDVTIPSGVSSAIFSFWYNITSSNESATIAYDYLNVYIQNTSGSNLATVAELSNVNKVAASGSSYYSQKTFDVTTYKGQTVRIFFLAVSNSSNPTTFRIDDVTIAVSYSKPSVTTSSASAASTSATLNGSVNPNGLAATAWFEYGTNSSLSTYTQTTSQSLVSGTTSQSISASLSGLSPSTTYYYRAVASNSVGTQSGLILNFTTQATPVVTRTLTVSSSNPNSGVSITVSPNDNNGYGNGTTSFTRTYNDKTSVTLTAPSTGGGNNFQKWQRNGADYSTSSSTSVTMDANYTMTAIYVTPVDTTPPTISSTSPANNATNVSVGTTITATFSEAIDPSTVTITLKQGNTYLSGNLSSTTQSATFTPSSTLAYNTTYTVAVQAGLKDSAGNTMANDYTWSFTTEASPPGPPSAPTDVTAIAGDGQVIIGWDNVSDATSYNIYWSTSSGVTKSTGTQITNVTNPYTHTGLTNSTTYYYVVTAVNSYGESNESNQVSGNPQSGWALSTIDSSGNVAYQTSIATDLNNKVHVSYYDWTNGDLKYATNASGSWEIATIDSLGNVGSYSSIAIDGNNKVHISYYDSTNGDIKYAANTSGSWVASTIDSTGDVGMSTSIAVDSNNKLHIAYRDSSNAVLKYATNASGSWATSIADSSFGAGLYASIAIDSNNKVHIGHFLNASSDLKYTTNASGSWVSATVDSTGSVGAYTSLALDTNNKAHISYLDSTDSVNDLKYATNASGAWVLSTIDSDGSVGSSSIAVDSNNKVHVAYSESTNGNLKYATTASGSWTTSIVDSIGGGYWAAITSDLNNKIHISYTNSNRHLKYANYSEGTTVTDIDGNVYNTVTIGAQVWMKENLKVTKYRNGDAIPITTSSITNDSSSKYQWAYDGNESNVTTYGRLYTWYAATDSRGVCPTGWHLPTDAEWTTLTDFLGGESVAGGKMKEAGTTHWNSPNTSADNSSGWTALPGGIRASLGSMFGSIGNSGYWWSATEHSPIYAWVRLLDYSLGSVYRTNIDKYDGYSVRCVRDSDSTAPSAPTGVSATAGDGQATITWDNVADATSYNVYWSTTSGVTKTTGTKISNVTSPYTHTGLTNGTIYYYVVTAVNTYGESSESSQVSAIPNAPTTTPTTLASGLNLPSGIAVDSNSVYWTENAATGGSVKKVSINGETVTTLASGLNAASGGQGYLAFNVVVDSTNVYWGEASTVYNGNDAAVRKVPINGGTLTTLASGLNQLVGIAAASTDVYWAEQGLSKVSKVAKGGGTITTLGNMWNYPIGVAVDSTSIYGAVNNNWWAGNGSVQKISINGGTATTLASGLNAPFSIAVDTTSVYWTDYHAYNGGDAQQSDGTGAVKKVSINGGTVTTLATGLNRPSSIVVDSASGYVYWTETGTYSGNTLNNGTGTVKKVPISGGTVTLLASGLNNPGSIAVDSTSVYWSESGTNTNGVYDTGTGTIKKMLKTGQTVDDVSPTGSISINSGVVYTNSTTATLTLSCTDASGCAEMQFSNDNTAWSTAETYATSKTWTLSSGDGTKTVYVKFNDTAGNWSTATISDTIVLDTTAPTTTASPAGGTYTSAQSVTLTCSDGTGSGCDKIYYTTDGSIPTTSSTVYSTPITVSTTKPLKFFAKDLAGNSETVKTENYTIDNVAPVLTLSTLSDNSVTNNNTLNISGTATDNTGVQGLTVSGISVTVNTDGSFSYALLINEGSNVITTVATDLAGNQTTDTRTITLDITAPALVIDTPADNSKTAASIATVTGTIDENSTVAVTLNGGTPQYASVIGSTFTANVVLISGINTVEIIATDMAGNTSTQKRTVTYDNTTPSLEITEPNQDIRTNQNSIVIRGTVSDTLTAVSVSVAVDGNTYTPTLANGQFEQAVTFTAEKTYTITVTATDEAGNTTTVQRNIIYDITQPTIDFTVTTPTNNTSLTITGTMEEGATVTVTSATAGIGTVTYPTSTAWSVNVTGMTEGDNTITATTTDAAGNETTVSKEIVVDTIVPDTTITSQPAALTNSTSASFSFTSTETGSTFECQLDSGAYSTCTSPKSYTGLTAGSHTFYVRANDSAGNTDATPASYTWTIDTTAPAFGSTSPSSDSFINTATVGYSLSKDVSSGKITFTRTGGTADSSSHVYTFTSSDLTAGTHSINTGLVLVNGAIYTVTFEATDSAENTGLVSSTNVTYDTTSGSVTISSPASNSVVNNAKVSYTLSEDISAGNIVFTRTGGTSDSMSPYTYPLSASERTTGNHTVDTGKTLMDGTIYTVSFENIKDIAGNSTAAVSNTNVTYDSTSVAITATSPTSNSIITTATVSFILSEQALSGKVSFTWTGGTADSSSPHLYDLTMSDLTAESHTINTNLTLVDGAFYTVTFEATDLIGNPATTVSNAMVYYDSGYGTGPVGNVDSSGASAMRVDGFDLIKLSLAFESRSGDANWNPACDLDGNGTVEGSDLIILGSHFGEAQ